MVQRGKSTDGIVQGSVDIKVNVKPPKGFTNHPGADAAPVPCKDEKAPFTIGDIKRAIPPRCFQPTLAESFFYLFKDLAECAFYAITMYYLDSKIEYTPLRILLWILYTWFQGVTMTGLWVIGHECGHGAFSLNETICDMVGFVIHSMLYVPYFSWKRTHSNHHHYTNHLTKDEVFVPSIPSATQIQGVQKCDTTRSPLSTIGQLVIMLVFGWPGYIIYNVSSQPSQSFNSHFWPNSPIFPKKDRIKVVLSVLGLIGWTYVLVLLGNTIGSWLLLRLYLFPLLVTNGFLVAITFLQHTDVRLPHYDSSEWTWLRGALCTVDRTMGSYLDRKLHYIHSTHVTHHIFHKIPFYRSHEATKAIVPVLGKFYLKDDSNFLLTLWRSTRDCNMLGDDRGIIYWLRDQMHK